MAFDVPVEVKVRADYACFTRPEMKVERVSYPVMTPSAARGVLEAIFWKPEFAWRVREIGVLRPIRYASFMRNEVNSRASERSAKTWAASDGGFFASEDRTQRNTLALYDVAYVIRADVVPVVAEPGAEAKYRDQFRRRVVRGQCFAQPYLGCREFTASFEAPDGRERYEEVTMDLGRMLLDLDYAPDRSGNATPRFFQAKVERGVLRVPRSAGEV